jgi:hypothetical protein
VKRIQWREIKAVMATDASKKECGKLVRRLREANFKVCRSDARTTKGTPCIRVYVEESKYEKARKLVRDLITARPAL